MSFLIKKIKIKNIYIFFYLFLNVKLLSVKNKLMLFILHRESCEHYCSDRNKLLHLENEFGTKIVNFVMSVNINIYQ